MTEEKVTANYPTLAAQIGTGFGCINLAGLTYLSGSENILIQVQDPSAKIYLQGTSMEAILNNTLDPALSASSNNSSLNSKIILLSFIKVTKNDRLYLNYEP